MTAPKIENPWRYEIWFRNEYCVATVSTKKGARRSRDRRDNEYGAYVHRIVPVYQDGPAGNTIT